MGAADTVEIWAWDLDGLAAQADAHWASLSPEEQARASRFVVPGLGPRFVAARGMLRQVLAALRGERPAELAIRTERDGKPYVVGGPHFNLSHSGSRALLAVAAFPLGVDIEAIRSIEDEVARIAFSPAEQAALQAVPPDRREAAFFRGWTRKEAVAKARGDGIGGWMAFDVSLDDSPAVLRADGDPAEAGCWQVTDWAAGPGFAAAVAARRVGWRVVPALTKAENLHP
ncbi:MAG: 4'-phosphopantetheinyl transferase superfamily protein [Acetobacteraceae bacterium]